MMLTLLTLTALTLALPTHHLDAQSRRGSSPAIDSMLASALAAAAQGDTTTALDILERANKQAPKDPEVLYQRGYLLARSTFLRVGDVPRNWLAWRLLDRASDLDPGNSRYLLEIGRIRLYTPLLRVEAERIFRKALRVAESSGDPNQVADVCWELGQIKERRYQASKDRYMLTSTGLMYDPAQAVQQKHYTREFLEAHSRPIDDAGSVDRSEAEEMYRRGLRAVPTHEANAVGLLGLLYDQKRYQEMRAVARPFLDAGTGSARLRFAAGLAAYRTGNLHDAGVLFDDALSRLTAAERDDILDLGRIIRRTDAVAYEALSEESRRQTDSAYWEAADPLLGTPENEGRLEFLARMAAADLRFSSADMRQVGWRTDRGLILARYGEPPVVATFAPTSAVDGGDATGRILTVWFYPRNERQFVFMGPPAMNYATFAGPMRGIAEEQREDAPFLLDNVPLAVGIDTVPMQLTRFRGTKEGQSELVVTATVDAKRLYRAVELDKSALALSLRFGPPSRMRVANADTVPITLPATGRTSRTWTHQLPTGRYRVRVEAQDVAVQGAAGRAQAEVELQRPALGAFEISDLLFAERFATPDAPLDTWKSSGIVPRADLSLAQREVFSVYWENYGLRAAPDGRVRYTVKLQVTLLEIDRSDQQAVSRFLGNVADVVGLTREKDEQLGVRFDREEAAGTRDRIPMVTTIGLGSSPAGTYRLEVIVTDKTTGSTARAERIFHLAKQ